MLFEIETDGSLNADSRCTAVQTEVKKIRAEKVREKDLLHAAMYKWALAAIQKSFDPVPLNLSTNCEAIRTAGKSRARGDLGIAVPCR